MNIFHTDNFLDDFKPLPISIKKLYEKQEGLFLLNWKDHRLHIKKLKKNDSIFSFRITRRYRVLFTFANEDTAFFISIGHRKDIYD